MHSVAPVFLVAFNRKAIGICVSYRVVHGLSDGSYGHLIVYGEVSEHEKLNTKRLRLTVKCGKTSFFVLFYLKTVILKGLNGIGPKSENTFSCRLFKVLNVTS